MSRPLLLDLFCGAGGAAMGYHRAGFDVIGVDINPQPDYPFPFYQGDALKFLAGPARFWNFNAIHASPPCQHHTGLAKGTNPNKSAAYPRRNDYPDLIPPTRKLLDETGLPYVIENVPGAPIRRDLTLCGEMFGLLVIRHRYFESNMALEPIPHKAHRGRVMHADYHPGKEHLRHIRGVYFGVHGHAQTSIDTMDNWRNAMGIDWITTRRALTEAIPPAYTEYIGMQLIELLDVA